MSFKKSVNIVFLALVASICIFYSCRKEKSITENYIQDDSFFKRDDALKGVFAATNGILADEGMLNKLINQFKEIDKSKQIVGKIKTKYGNAMWDLGIASKNVNGYDVIVIPLVNNDSQVTALLFANVKNDYSTKFTIIRKGAKIKGLPLYGDKNATQFTQQTLDGLFAATSNKLIQVREINNGIKTNGVIINWTCWQYTWAYTDENGGVVVGATIPQCSYNVIYKSDAPDDPDDGGDSNWTYNYTTSPNQVIVDSLHGYPCVQNLAGQAFLSNSGICNEIASLISGTFNGTGSNVNLHYQVDNTLTMSNPLNGYTDSVRTGTAPYSYEQYVELNPWVLQNSSQEFILLVMIHEGIHSTIDYWFKQYRNNVIDSNQFKNMFPLFWDYQRPRSAQELGQHTQMAEAYVSQLKSLLQGFNSNISDSMSTALAWMGLQETTAWKARTDTSQLVDLQHIARRDTGDSSRYSSYHLKKCP